jgi:hypothetical protein
VNQVVERIVVTTRNGERGTSTRIGLDPAIHIAAILNGARIRDDCMTRGVEGCVKGEWQENMHAMGMGEA